MVKLGTIVVNYISEEELKSETCSELKALALLLLEVGGTVTTLSNEVQSLYFECFALTNSDENDFMRLGEIIQPHTDTKIWRWRVPRFSARSPASTFLASRLL